MHNLSISDLNSIQFDEKFTGQLLVNVENGRIVRNYHLPDGAIAGSVEALLELAERARLIKPSTSHHFYRMYGESLRKRRRGILRTAA